MTREASEALAARCEQANIWAAVPRRLGMYEVSPLGQVRRSGDGLILKASSPRNSREYPAVMLRGPEGRKRRNIHVLVANAFVGKPPFPGAQVRHKDGDHRNPRWDNLEWGTALDNASDRDRHGRTQRGERHWCSRLSDKQRAEIEASKEPTKVLAERYGVHRTRIQRIRAITAAALRAHAAKEGE